MSDEQTLLKAVEALPDGATWSEMTDALLKFIAQRSGAVLTAGQRVELGRKLPTAAHPKANRHFDELPDEFIDVVRKKPSALAASPTSWSEPIAPWSVVPLQRRRLRRDALVLHHYFQVLAGRDRAAHSEHHLARTD